MSLEIRREAVNCVKISCEEQQDRNRNQKTEMPAKTHIENSLRDTFKVANDEET